MAVYLDPRVFFIALASAYLGARLTQQQNPWLMATKQLLTSIAIIFILAGKEWWQNTTNLWYVQEPSVNMGAFWYMMPEMFPSHLPFLRLMYVISHASMCVFITILCSKTYDVILPDAATKRTKLYLNAVLLLSFVKLIMNPYPSLHDLAYTAYWICLSSSLVRKEIPTPLLFVFFCIVGYCLLSSTLLWCTWQLRFSGNANFFWF